MFDVDWVDAFSDVAFGGNGCAVVHGGASLDADTCMAFVRETSLVECTFTGPSATADIRIRYFLASREIPFAGHPTIATVVAMRHRGLIADGPLTLETGAGQVSVVVAGNRVEMTQIAPVFGATVPADVVAAVGQIDPADIIAPPQIVSTGLAFCITIVRDRATLDRLSLDPDAFARYAQDFTDGSSDMMEPFWAALDGPDEADTFARLLLLPPSPPEDPFTGSATGAMGAYLWRHGMMQKDSFVAEQGHGMGRPGQARVTRVGPAGDMAGIRVSGSGFILMRGRADLPVRAQVQD